MDEEVAASAPAPIREQQSEPVPLLRWLYEEEEEAPDDELSGVLDIFREVLPDDRTRSGRARQAAVENAALNHVTIRELLAEARWTARALSSRP
jgi:hypothetical protein